MLFLNKLNMLYFLNRRSEPSSSQSVFEESSCRRVQVKSGQLELATGSIVVMVWRHLHAVILFRIYRWSFRVHITFIYIFERLEWNGLVSVWGCNLQYFFVINCHIKGRLGWSSSGRQSEIFNKSLGLLLLLLLGHVLRADSACCERT